MTESLDNNTQLITYHAYNASTYVIRASCVRADVAGLTLPDSTDPLEGHINRLKLLKRQSFGRAGVTH